MTYLNPRFHSHVASAPVMKAAQEECDNLQRQAQVLYKCSVNSAEMLVEKAKERAEQEYIAALSALIPKHLPKPTKRMGDGYYGTAFASTHKDWIVKITADTVEAPKLKKLIEVAPHLVCDILAIIEVGTACTIIIKERCTDWRDKFRHVQTEAFRDKLDEFLDCNDAHTENVGIDRQGILVAFDI